MTKSIISGLGVLIAVLAIVLGLVGAYDLSAAGAVALGFCGFVFTIFFARFGGFAPIFSWASPTTQEDDLTGAATATISSDSRRLVTVGGETVDEDPTSLFGSKLPASDGEIDDPDRPGLFGESLSERLAADREEVDGPAWAEQQGGSEIRADLGEVGTSLGRGRTQWGADLGEAADSSETTEASPEGGIEAETNPSWVADSDSPDDTAVSFDAALDTDDETASAADVDADAASRTPVAGSGSSLFGAALRTASSDDSDHDPDHDAGTEIEGPAAAPDRANAEAESTPEMSDSDHAAEEVGSGADITQTTVDEPDVADAGDIEEVEVEVEDVDVTAEDPAAVADSDPTDDVPDHADSPEPAIEAIPPTRVGPEPATTVLDSVELDDDDADLLAASLDSLAPADPFAPRVETEYVPEPIVTASTGLAIASGTELPVVVESPASLELHHYSESEIMSVVKSQESQLVNTLIDEGVLSTEGPLTEKDIRTMVFVAVSSNELIDVLTEGQRDAVALKGGGRHQLGS